MVYDISPPITDALQVWPGDTPPSREMLGEIKDGATVTLSTLRATVHLGAHADAPNHYAEGAPGIGERPLDYYLGPCQVIRVPVSRGALIEPAAVTVGIRAQRVLFATGTFPDPTSFNEDFAALSGHLVEKLAASGVRLVGIDAPSVDPFGSNDLPAHKACLMHDVAILEGLCLDGVPEGLYELIALPLRLIGFDGSPVRAVLRSVSGQDQPPNDRA